VSDSKKNEQTITPTGAESLATPIQPAAANHSYNGIMFDIKAKGPQDVEILGFSVGGTLGPTTIYVRSGSWADDKTDKSWSRVLSRDFDGSWQTTYVPLSIPVIILSGEKRGFYIHCTVNHDNALYYQTYNSFGQVCAQDKHIVIFPGRARCGPNAFGYRGDWRTVRGFSGIVSYRPVKKIWTPKTHNDFPKSFKTIVMILMMLWYRDDSIFHNIPQEALFEIMQCMEWDWFEEDQMALVKSEPSDNTSDHLVPEYWGDGYW